jgi:uncharacterized protein YfdQ (DUF2303 family)
MTTKITEQLLSDAFEAGALSMDPTRRTATVKHPRSNREIPIAVRQEGNGAIYVGVAEDIEARMAALAPAPDRNKGTQSLADLDSFTAHVNRFKTATTVIYSDIAAFSLTAVYNEGGDAVNPAWRDHRAIYTCPRSPQWVLWTSRDGKAQTQEDFADFVEANLHDISAAKGYPAPTEILAMARDLMVLTKGTFQRQINPTSGAGILVCKTETETGSTQIPRAFALTIPVFDGGAPYHVEARIRFALTNGQPTFTYNLHRRTEIERDAFHDVRKQAAEATERPVWAGKA